MFFKRWRDRHKVSGELTDTGPGRMTVKDEAEFRKRREQLRRELDKLADDDTSCSSTRLAAILAALMTWLVVIATESIIQLVVGTEVPALCFMALACVGAALPFLVFAIVVNHNEPDYRGASLR